MGSFGALAALLSLSACTALLGDFEVVASTGTPDTGTPDTPSTIDSGPDSPADVEPDVKPIGLNGVHAIAAGARHTCAIANLGEVFCWGDNTQGQLAQPASIQRLAKPRKVAINGVATKIATTANHTCVVMMNNDINCWGSNASGQCATGDQNSPALPHVVAGGKQWEEVEPGVEHTCGVDQSGQVYCWGANNASQSGTIPGTGSLAPTNAGAEKTPMGSIAAANNHTCGRVLGGANGMRCWGTEDHGQLGNGGGNIDTQATAVSVLAGVEVKQVAVGGAHSCALDANGDVKCWGDNALGQLGITPAGSTLDAPGMKIGTQAISAISASAATSCGITVMNRTLACVGSNASGQLGRGGTKDTSPHPEVLPVLRPDNSGMPMEGVAFVAVGRDHVCAVVGAGGDVFCWGEGADGQVGDTFGGMPRTLPVRVSLPE